MGDGHENRKQDKNPDKPDEEEFDRTWKTKPRVKTRFGVLGFSMGLDFTTPPKKPDDEPLQ